MMYCWLNPFLLVQVCPPLMKQWMDVCFGSLAWAYGPQVSA